MAQALPTVHFVAGVPRGGTTFLLRRLHQHPEVMGFGESAFFGNNWVEPGPGGVLDAAQLALVADRLLANPLNSNLRRPDDPTGRPGWIDHIDSAVAHERLRSLFGAVQVPIEPGDLFRRVCGMLADGSGASVVVEKTPHHVRHVDRILRAVPEAKMVIVIRDPYDFLLSYKHAGERRSEERRAVDDRLWHPLGVGLLWRSYVRAAEAARREHPDRVMVVRLEEVSEAPAESMARILTFLGLPTADVLAGAPVRDNSSFSGRRPELAAGDVAAFNALGRRDAVRAGYAVRRSGAGPICVLRMIAGLVPWVVRNVASAHRRTDVGLLRYARSALFRGRQGLNPQTRRDRR